MENFRDLEHFTFLTNLKVIFSFHSFHYEATQTEIIHTDSTTY